ncbi:MAG TPA: hypothetical protein VNM92_18620 [Thermoanaerobaculia bacterium]|nr:hypothetical protein [Thermoanaerobaculia bacterium]
MSRVIAIRTSRTATIQAAEIAILIQRSLRRQMPELDPKVFVDESGVTVRGAERVDGQPGRRFPVIFRIEVPDETSWRVECESDSAAESHGFLNKLRRLARA